MDLSAALVVVGFPGIGLAGSIAANYLVSTLKLEKVASILSPGFPPMGVLHGGRVSSPARIYAAPMVCGEAGKCNQLAVVMGEVTPRAEVLYELCENLLAWCQEKGVVEILVVDGLMRSEGSEEAGVYGVANTAEGLERLQGMQVSAMEEGILSGLAGMLTYLGEARGLKVMSLLAETTKEYPDARAAARLVEILDPLVPKIEIDPQPLYRQAELIEGHLKRSLKEHEDSIADLTERSKIMYG